MSKKYKLTSETLKVSGVTLYQIEALKDIPELNVKKGDLGGFVHSEKNLDQKGNCWISPTARVYCTAVVLEDAYIFEHASISGSAVVKGHVRVYGEAQVFGDAELSGYVIVGDHVQIYGKAKVSGKGLTYGHCRVYVEGQVQVFGNAVVKGSAKLSGDVFITTKCTKTPLVIKGLPIPVTITDTHLDIGGVTLKFKAWENFDNIPPYDPIFNKLVKEYLPVLLSLCKDHCKGFK